MTGLWESIYEQLDSFENRIYGADFFPNMGIDAFGKVYPTQIIIYVHFGVGSTGTIEAH